MMSARFRRHTKRATKSFRNKRLISQHCEVGFHGAVLSFQCVAYIGKIQEEFLSTVQNGCKIMSQQKGDFATLCKILPSAWSDRLAMVVTPSFQLRIVHRLKHWIVNFLRFETTYGMHKLDFRKCSKSGWYNCHQEYASWQISLCFLSLNSGFTYGKGLQSFGSSCFWASNCFSKDST